MFFSYRPIAILLCAAACVLPGAAAAVELGEPLMRSYLGQSLSADIELTGLASESAPVQAALADLDVYRAASTAMPPALEGAAITVVRRDGRRFVHIASPVAVKADHLVVFLALTENGQRVLRQTTLWLTPDPNPAPPPVAAKAMPAPAALPAGLGAAVPPAAAGPIAQPPSAAAKAAAAAPVAAPVAAPTAAPIAAPLSSPLPAAVPFVPAPASVRHPVTLPRAVAAAPACPKPGSAVAPDPTCLALDSKNAALTAHLSELEGKIKQLTAALQGGAAAAAGAAGSTAVVKEASVSAPAVASAASSAAAAAPPAIKPASKDVKKVVATPPLPAKLVPMGSTPPPASSAPWLIISIVAAIILSLVGVLTAVLLRQRHKKLKKTASEAIAAAARPSFISNVKNRLMPAKAASPEPVDEEVEVANTQPAH